ncbi:MAG: hypothetical protein JSS89_05065 [Bacteroidetes bacterium]|nr:hypothetical protein [Bacteroidota bacterium]
MKFLLLSFVAIASIGCSKLPFVDTYTPAPLHARKSGLYEQDFRAQQRKYAAAVAMLKERPSDVKAYAALATIYMTEARITGEHPYYYPVALNAIDHGLMQHAHDEELLMLKTSVLLSLHHFAEARALATDLITRAPNAAPVYGMLVDANVELGYYDQAIRAADKMMSIRPGLESYARVSHLREIHGDTLGALEAMKMAVQAGMPGTDDAAWTRTTYGSLLFAMGKHAEAEEQFQLARLERYNYPFALAGLARLRRASHNYDAARALLDTAIAMIPEVSFMEEKAGIAADQGNKAEEMALLAEIERMLDEDEAAGHKNDAERAMIYARHGYKLDDARRHAEQEYATRPKNKTAQQALAMVQRVRGGQR